MSDDKPRPADETQPVRPEGSPLPPAPPAAAPASTEAPATAAQPAYVAAPAPVARRGFRERLGSVGRSDGSRTFGLAALIASALAGIIVGGLGTVAVHAIGDDHDRGGPGEHGPMGRGRDGDDGGPGRMFGGPGMPGQVQPTTPPDGDSDG